MQARCLSLLVLMLLLSLAGAADDCADCSGAGSPHCCPPACSLCLCCGQSPTILASAPGMQPGLDRVSVSSGSQERSPLAAHRHDVFHIPKSFLI
jgi:hypothetical protein